MKFLTASFLSFVVFCNCLSAQTEWSRFQRIFFEYQDGWVRNGAAGRYDSALYYAHKIDSFTLAEKGPVSLGQALAHCHFLGFLAVIRGDDNTAYLEKKKGLNIFHQLKDDSSADFVYNLYEYAVVCLQVGARQEANSALFQAMPLLKKMGYPEEYAHTCLVLGSQLTEQGEYERASSLFQIAEQILDTIATNKQVFYLQSSLNNNQSLLNVAIGNEAKAFGNLKKAVNVSRTAGIQYYNSDYFQMVLNLAAMYTKAGRLDSAVALCQEAENGLAITNDPYTHSLLLSRKAEIAHKKKDFTTAISLYNKYIAAANLLPQKNTDFYPTCFNLASSYVMNHQVEQADSLYRFIIFATQQSGLERSYPLQEARAGLCTILIAQGRYREAADSLLKAISQTFYHMKRNFGGLSEADQLFYRKILDRYFDMAYSCAYLDKDVLKKHKTELTTFQLMRKSLVLHSQMQVASAIRRSQDTTLAYLFDDWKRAKEKLSFQLGLPRAYRQLNIDSLEEIIQQRERQMSTYGYSVSGGDDIKKHTLAATAGKAYIDFIRFIDLSTSDKAEAKYAAEVYSPGHSVAQLVFICSEQDILRLMRDERGKTMDANQLTRILYDSQSPNARKLFQLIWAPLTPYLKTAKEIGYTTSGLINNLAIAAIYDGHDHLVNRYRLKRYLSLLDAMDITEADHKPSQIHLWGNMNYGKTVNSAARKPSGQFGESAENFTSLAGTELPAIQSLFRQHGDTALLYQNKLATKTAFKQRAPAMSGTVHISTHGFYHPEDPNTNADQSDLPALFEKHPDPLLRSGLAFSGANVPVAGNDGLTGKDNGILTAYEVSELDLHRVDLVTLSACETALGDVTDNEGNLGLQRAFKIAGAKKLLVSLWEIPARQTAELLALFYKNWLNGASMSESLRVAQQTFQKKYPPFFWAGFVLFE